MNKYSINKVPSDVLKETAQKVREIRKIAGYTQKELAERSGVSHGSIKRFESSGQISLESFLKLLFLLKRLDEFDGILHQDKNMEEVERLFTNK